MTVYAIQRDWGPTPSGPLVRIVTDSAVEEVIATGWLALQEADIERVNNGPFEWGLTDNVLLTIINPPDAAVDPGKSSYVNLFTVFSDLRSLNPISSITPNLQNITAHAGGGQTDATQLNIGINVVTTVASTGDSVKLPDDVLGQTVTVTNRGTNVLALYPFLGDSIDQNAVNAPVYVSPGETYQVIGSSTNNWTSINISPVMLSNQNITAHAGGGQAAATILRVGVNTVSTVATAGDSVKLPPNAIGQQFVVVNLSANALDIFPPIGGNLENTAINTAISLAPGRSNWITGCTATFYAYK